MYETYFLNIFRSTCCLVNPKAVLLSADQMQLGNKLDKTCNNLIKNLFGQSACFVFSQSAILSIRSLSVFLVFGTILCGFLRGPNGAGPINILQSKVTLWYLFKHFDWMLKQFNQSKWLKKLHNTKFTL